MFIIQVSSWIKNTAVGLSSKQPRIDLLAALYQILTLSLILKTIFKNADGRETWNLRARFWRPSFSWPTFTGLREITWSLTPSSRSARTEFYRCSCFLSVCIREYNSELSNHLSLGYLARIVTIFVCGSSCQDTLPTAKFPIIKFLRFSNRIYMS